VGRVCGKRTRDSQGLVSDPSFSDTTKSRDLRRNKKYRSLSPSEYPQNGVSNLKYLSWERAASEAYQQSIPTHVGTTSYHAYESQSKKWNEGYSGHYQKDYASHTRAQMSFDAAPLSNETCFVISLMCDRRGSFGISLSNDLFIRTVSPWAYSFGVRRGQKIIGVLFQGTLVRTRNLRDFEFWCKSTEKLLHLIVDVTDRRYLLRDLRRSYESRFVRAVPDHFQNSISGLLGVLSHEETLNVHSLSKQGFSAQRSTASRESPPPSKSNRRRVGHESIRAAICQNIVPDTKENQDSAAFVSLLRDSQRALLRLSGSNSQRGIADDQDTRRDGGSSRANDNDLRVSSSSISQNRMDFFKSTASASHLPAFSRLDQGLDEHLKSSSIVRALCHDLRGEIDSFDAEISLARIIVNARELHFDRQKSKVGDGITACGLFEWKHFALGAEEAHQVMSPMRRSRLCSLLLVDEESAILRMNTLQKYRSGPTLDGIRGSPISRLLHFEGFSFAAAIYACAPLLPWRNGNFEVEVMQFAHFVVMYMIVILQVSTPDREELCRMILMNDGTLKSSVSSRLRELGASDEQLSPLLRANHFRLKSILLKLFGFPVISYIFDYFDRNHNKMCEGDGVWENVLSACLERAHLTDVHGDRASQLLRGLNNGHCGYGVICKACEHEMCKIISDRSCVRCNRSKPRTALWSCVKCDIGEEICFECVKISDVGTCISVKKLQSSLLPLSYPTDSSDSNEE